MMRWTAVENYRAVEVDEPVNYRWDPEKGLVAVDAQEKNDG